VCNQQSGRVETLLLDSNNITSLSSKVNLCTELVELRLDVSTLVEIPNLTSLRKLRILSFSTCGTERVGRLPDSVVELDASENNLAQLFRLPLSLQKLNVRSNRITQIFDDDLPPGLEELAVAGNPSISLPGKLPERLRVLYAYSCMLKVLPLLPAALEVLIVNNNELSEIRQYGPSSVLRILQAKGNLLRNLTLPPVMPLLETCDLSQNYLVEIPAPVLTSPALKRIDMSFNRMRGPVQRDLFLLSTGRARGLIQSVNFKGSYKFSGARGSLSEEALRDLDPSGVILTDGLLPVAMEVVLADTNLEGPLFLGLLDKTFRAVKNLDLSGNSVHEVPLRTTNFQEGAVIDIRGNSNPELKLFLLGSLDPSAPTPDGISTFGARNALTVPISINGTQSGRGLQMLTVFGAMCTIAAEVGLGQRFTLILDPELVGYSEKFCNCTREFVGLASGQRCQRCDTVVDAIEPRSSIDCNGTSGSLHGFGVWMYPSPVGDIKAISCPRTGSSSPCQRSTVRALPPAVSDKLNNLSGLNLTELGSAWMNSVEFSCVDGYQKSRFCSKCAIGFFRASRKCSPCEANGDALRFYVSLAVTLLSYILITLIHIREEELDAKGERVSRWASDSIIPPGERLAHIAFLAFFIQIVHSINSIFLVPMPKWVYSSLWAPMAATSLTLDGMECITRDERTQFLKPFIAGCLQPFVAALTALFASLLRALVLPMVRRLWKGRGGGGGGDEGGDVLARPLRVSARRAFHQAWKAFVYLWLLGIFPSLRSLFSIFSCTTLGSPPAQFGLDRSFVSSFLYVPCNKSDPLYSLGHSLAVAGVTYSLVIPPLIIIVAHRRRVDGSAGLGAALSRAYRPGFSGYEVINFLRSVGFALAHGIVPMGFAAAVISILVSLTFSISLATWAKPYESRLNNRMNTAGLVICLFSFIVWQSATGNWTSPEWVGSIIFVVQAAFVLTNLIAIFGFWPKKLGRTMELSSRRTSMTLAHMPPNERFLK
jgi:hypothetical protein